MKKHKTFGKGKCSAHVCGKAAKETKFVVDKKYNFDVYKMDPSVNVLTKTKVDF